MLIQLRIRDYAVIDELDLDLEPGLNVLSGETGAGKSIIVGALSLLLGERASSDVVRAGSERAVVEAVFDVSELPGVRTAAEELGAEAEEGLLILKRRVSREGRNRAWINGSPATASMVWELGSALVDLHGQHEHQTLLATSEQRQILDAFAEAGDAAGRVRELYGSLRELKDEREGRRERLRELESRADFLRFQLQEIEEAELEPGEDEALEEEARRLEHSEELVEEAGRLHDGLYAGESAVSERLSELRRILRRLAEIDGSLGPDAERLDEAYHIVVDVGRAMADYGAEIEHDPRRLEEIRERQDLFFRLKRKYGPELDDVIETGRRVRAELEELDAADTDLDALDRKIEETRTELREAASVLSERRREAGEELAGEVGRLLPELGMEGGVFRVQLTPKDEPDATGAERVEFRASLNPGFDPGPLARIASGGELSRVMLALKAILARVDRIPTLIFDEVDAGIGGVVAGRVAAKLRDVSEHHQVFVITHLPQVASRARQHLRVEKAERGGLATTVVSQLGGEDRVREIARMLGGDPESSASRDHARELLHAG